MREKYQPRHALDPHTYSMWHILGTGAVGAGGLLLTWGNLSLPDTAPPRICTVNTNGWSDVQSHTPAEALAEKLGVTARNVMDGLVGSAVCTEGIRSIIVPENESLSIIGIPANLHILSRCIAMQTAPVPEQVFKHTQVLCPAAP